MGYGYGISDARGYVNARAIREAKPARLPVEVVYSPAGDILGAIVDSEFFARQDYDLEGAFAKLDENPFEEER